MSPCVIVLAAGFGRRFGAGPHKLQQTLGESTVLASTLARVIESGLPMVVVTTARLAPAVQELVARNDVIVVDADQAPGGSFGMGLSIAAGVQARPNAPGWLVMPADMPLVRPDTLLAVAAALQAHPIAYAQHRGRRGHPVGFSSEFYNELVNLRGDDGARRVTARYPAVAIEVDDGGALMDIDTAEDLMLARAYHAADEAMR